MTTSGVRTVVYSVKDLGATKPLFTALFGAEPGVDSPYYVGWTVGGQDVGLSPNDGSEPTGPTPYWKVDDIKATLAALVAAGATISREASDVGGGRTIATVTDQAGNVIGILQDS